MIRPRPAWLEPRTGFLEHRFGVYLKEIQLTRGLEVWTGYGIFQDYSNRFPRCLGQQQSAFLASDILERAGQRNSIENAKNPSYEYSLSKEFQKAQQYEGRIIPTPHLML